MHLLSNVEHFKMLIDSLKQTFSTLFVVNRLKPGSTAAALMHNPVGFTSTKLKFFWLPLSKKKNDPKAFLHIFQSASYSYCKPMSFKTSDVYPYSIFALLNPAGKYFFDRILSDQQEMVCKQTLKTAFW